MYGCYLQTVATTAHTMQAAMVREGSTLQYSQSLCSSLIDHVCVVMEM